MLANVVNESMGLMKCSPDSHLVPPSQSRIRFVFGNQLAANVVLPVFGRPWMRMRASDGLRWLTVGVVGSGMVLLLV